MIDDRYYSDYLNAKNTFAPEVWGSQYAFDEWANAQAKANPMWMVESYPQILRQRRQAEKYMREMDAIKAYEQQMAGNDVQNQMREKFGLR